MANNALNRLVKTYTYNGLNAATNSWSKISIDAYREQISYDANGNIQTYVRNSETGAARNNYSYTYTSGTNRLASITNSVNTETKTYGYDEIGNTTEDGMQGMTNGVWNVYGKLVSAINKDGQSISYTYGADGERISKKVDNTEEWYVRDASGNIMATYRKDAAVNGGDLSVTELYKYGSGVLGVREEKINVESLFIDDGTTSFVRGSDNYILGDGNGNTKVTISDKKVQHSSDGLIVDYYMAEVRTATIHSSYGANAKTYNGGFEQANFNGQRKSLEIGADAQTALYWEYNGDVGRRWNVDPLANKFPWQSPYIAMDDNPVLKTDPTGMAASPPDEFDRNGNKISNLGGDKIDFYHQKNGDTKIVDRKTGLSNVIKGGEKLIQGYTQRDANTSLSTITKEFLNGTGATNSMFTDFTSTSTSGPFESLHSSFSSYSSPVREKSINSKDLKGTFKMDYLHANPLMAKDMWEQMWGRTNVSWYKLGDKTLFFMNDSKSATSLSYRASSNWERTKHKIMGNTYQTYIWIETSSQVQSKVGEYNNYWNKQVERLQREITSGPKF